jgi:hypothetical protein
MELGRKGEWRDGKGLGGIVEGELGCRGFGEG